MNLPEFSICNITQVVNGIENAYERIETRKKWQRFAHLGLIQNEKAILKQAAFFNKSYGMRQRNILANSMKIWKNHLKWIQFRKKIVQKCNIFIFKHLAKLIAEKRRKAKRQQWIKLSNQLIVNFNKNETARFYHELCDIRSAKNIMEEWHIYRVAAGLVRKQKMGELISNYIKKAKHDNFVKRQKEYENVMKWDQMRQGCMLLNIHKVYEHEKFVEHLQENWRKIEHDVESVLLKKQRLEEVQKQCDKLKDLKSKWKELQEAIALQKLNENLQKGLVTLQKIRKWEDLSKRNVKRVRKMVLKAGSEYIKQSREMLRTKQLSKEMLRKWSTYSHARNYVRDLYNAITRDYSVAFQHQCASMIQSAFRANYARKKLMRDRFLKERSFNIWRAMKLVRDKAHTKFPKMEKNFALPQIRIAIPKIAKMVKMEQPLQRLEPIREMYDLKKKLMQKGKSEKKKYHVEEEEEEDSFIFESNDNQNKAQHIIPLKEQEIHSYSEDYEEEEAEYATTQSATEPETKDISIQPSPSDVKELLINNINQILDKKEKQQQQQMANVFSDESSVFSSESEDAQEIPSDKVFSDETEEEEEEEKKEEKPNTLSLTNEISEPFKPEVEPQHHEEEEHLEATFSSESESSYE